MDKPPQTQAERDASRRESEERIRGLEKIALELKAKKDAAQGGGEKDVEPVPKDDKSKKGKIPGLAGRIFGNLKNSAKEMFRPKESLLAEALRLAKEGKSKKEKGQDKSPTPENKIKKPKKEKAPIDREKEADDFIADWEFNLANILPAGFENLERGQKLLVFKNLQRRIVDIVKSDAQTQYSEELKGKSTWAKIKAGVTKEKDMKNLEAKIFKELNNIEEGKELIAQNLKLLTQSAREKRVFVQMGKPEILFVDHDVNNSHEEMMAVEGFNRAANNFQQMPYEWGQEKSGKNKKSYDKAKAEYDKAKNAVLEVEEKHKGRERAMTNMLQLDNAVQIEQLTTTHPEFEKEFTRIAETAGGKELVKTGLNFLQTMTGGKNLTNKLLFAGGFGARAAVAGLATTVGAMTFIATPIIGGAIGWVRGGVRGKETLAEKKKQGRHGQKDKSLERAATFEAKQLIKNLDRTINQAQNAHSEEDREKFLALLSARIEYTQSKIEKGEVNFGDAKSSLENQYALIFGLNEAIHTVTYNNSVINEQLEARLQKFSSFYAEKTSKAQNAFIKKQMVRGALMGAGFATAGSMVRYFGEYLGWWGGEDVEDIKTGAKLPPSVTSDSAVVTESPVVRPDSAETARIHERYLAKLREIKVAKGDSIADSKADSIAKFKADSLPSAKTDSTVADTLRGAGGKSPLTAPDSVAAAAEAARKAVGGAASVAAEASPEWTHPMEFKVPGPLEHAYEKLVLDHNLPDKLPTTGVVLNQEDATRTLNEAANLVRLTEGHPTAGVTLDQFKEAFSYENGVLKVLNPKKAGAILDRLHEHSGELVKNGTFNDPDSATGYIKNVNWTDKVQAADMHAVEKEIGHPEITENQIEDFSKIPDGADTGIGGETISSPETGIDSEAFLEAQRQYIENPSGIVDPSEIQNVVSETPTTPAKTLSPEEILGKPQPDNIADNPFQLSEALLKIVDDTSKENIRHIFPNDTDLMWTSVKDGSAHVWSNTDENSAENTEKGLSSFISYLRKLRVISDLKPRPETALKSAETNAEYVSRALQKIAQMGQLDKVKM